MDPSSVGIGEKVFGWLVRRWRRRYPLSPLIPRVREEWAKGREILREAQLAREDQFALIRLTRSAVEWYGEFERWLAIASPVLYRRFENPTAVVPSDLKDLRRSLRSDLRRLRRIERALRWPRLARLVRGREPA